MQFTQSLVHMNHSCPIYFSFFFEKLGISLINYNIYIIIFLKIHYLVLILSKDIKIDT